MIAQLQGIVAPLDADRVLVDVGGVGYEVFVSAIARQTLTDGEDVSLLIHTHMSDASIRLFGFSTAAEKALFERLISVSGIGPKTAIGILSGMPAHDLIAAIIRADVKRLSKLPGIGKKTAERIVVDLKDRLAKTAPAPQPSIERSQPEEDAVAALVHLGYRQNEAIQAVARALQVDRELQTDASALVKGALQNLAKV